MPTAFTITTPTTAIALDPERRALVVFTVANQTGRSLRARMSVSPFAPASAEWFKIEGDSERLLPLGSSETFNVRIAVPTDVAPGKQAFRVDVVSVERPDEEWAHGPAVGFEVPAPPVITQPQPAKGYVETAIGAVAGALGGILIGVGLGIGALAVYSATAPFFWFGPPLDFFMNWFRPLFSGDIALATALGGAVGVLVVLTLRGVPAPDPISTALPYGAAALVLVTLVEALFLILFPIPGIEPVARGLLLATAGALVASALSALAARAFARWRMLGTL